MGNSSGEDFADMFMNWVENSFDTNAASQARYSWMKAHMALFVDKRLQP